MPDSPPSNLDPTDGATPVAAIPAQDACCQSPCDPPWRIAPVCTTFTETKTLVLPLEEGVRTNDFGRGVVTVKITYTHTLCLVGKQHGPLAYVLTLFPGETMTLFQSDRNRRTTSESTRFSVQTTFAQFFSALTTVHGSQDTSVLEQVLNSQTQSGSSSTGFLTGLFANASGSGSKSSSSASDVSIQSSADQFVSVAQQAAQYTDLQRATTVSSFEDDDKVSTTKRVLTNPNVCFAVNYFVRKVMDVYVSTTKVTAVTFQVTAGAYVSPTLTPSQISQVESQLRQTVENLLQGLPHVGEVMQHPTTIALPTDGLVYDPELAHCCVRDPALEQADRIKLEREQAQAQRIGLEVQLMALEVQRRQALLAAGTLTPFETMAPTTIVA